MPLERRVGQALDALGAMGPGDTVLTAVSGGADSVALLRLFCSLRERRGCAVAAAHLHHGIRGADADADEAFVRALCAELDVPLTVGYTDVPALAAAQGMGIEQAARQARYAFLAQAKTDTGATDIATAHHLEDQAETVLLHLARGCGLAGLTGMRARQGDVIRPLLGVRREELRGYLTACGQTWREDATNSDTAYARNFVRAKVLPELTRLNPHVADALAAMAERLWLDEQYLTAQAHALGVLPITPMRYGGCLRVGDLPHAHEALVRRVMRAALDFCGVAQIESRHVQALCELVGAEVGDSRNLPESWRAMRGKAHIHLLSPQPEPAPEPVRLALDGDSLLWDGMHITARAARPDELGDGVRTQVLDAAMLEHAVVRVRKTGDRFAPLNGTGSQPLKQTLIDRSVDRPFREVLPIVAHGGDTLWVVGIAPADIAKITARTKRAIHLTFTGSLPWER